MRIVRSVSRPAVPISVVRRPLIMQMSHATRQNKTPRRDGPTGRRVIDELSTPSSSSSASRPMSAPRVITGHPQLTMHREWTGLTALDLGADGERRKDDACNSLSAASSSPAVDALRRRHPLADKFSTNRAPRFYRDFGAM